MKKITNVYFTLFLFAFAIGSMNMVFGTEKVLAYSDGGGAGGNGGCCGGGRGPEGNDRDRPDYNPPKPPKKCTNGATNYPGCNKCPSGKVYKHGKCVNPPKQCPQGYVLKQGKCKKITTNCGTPNCGSGGQNSNYGNQNNGNGVQSVYQSYIYNYTNNYINNITNNYVSSNTWNNQERTHGR